MLCAEWIKYNFKLNILTSQRCTTDLHNRIWIHQHEPKNTEPLTTTIDNVIITSFKMFISPLSAIHQIPNVITIYFHSFSKFHKVFLLSSLAPSNSTRLLEKKLRLIFSQSLCKNFFRKWNYGYYFLLIAHLYDKHWLFFWIFHSNLIWVEMKLVRNTISNKVEVWKGMKSRLTDWINWINHLR